MFGCFWNFFNFLNELGNSLIFGDGFSVIGDTYEQLDAIVACFPWCGGGGASGARCIPRSSRCKPYF